MRLGYTSWCFVLPDYSSVDNICSELAIKTNYILENTVDKKHEYENNHCKFWNYKPVFMRHFLPLFLSVQDDAEYYRCLKLSHAFPSGVILLQGGEIKDCCVVYGECFIKSPQLSTISLFTVLLALYYILEINYPKCFIQAMGALASFVLNHNYYKLGLRASKMLRLLN